MRRYVCLVLWFVACVLVIVAPALLAQEKPAPPKPPEVAAVAPEKLPVLTDVQKLQLKDPLQRIEIAQLRMEQARRDFEQARTELLALVQGLQVAGFDLDLQTLLYVKKAEPPKAPKS
jgi:hypothetical protein